MFVCSIVAGIACFADRFLTQTVMWCIVRNSISQRDIKVDKITPPAAQHQRAADTLMHS